MIHSKSRILGLLMAMAMVMLVTMAAPVLADEPVTKIRDLTSIIKNSEAYPEILKEIELQSRTRAPAPPLSAVYVMEIWSEKGGNEELGYASGATTVYEHGGKLEFLTYEQGYANGTYRKANYRDALNGGSCYMVQNEGIDLNGDRIIDGFAQVWQSYGDMGSNSGKFTFESMSLVYPYNTFSTYLNVR